MEKFYPTQDIPIEFLSILFFISFEGLSEIPHAKIPPD